jgi:hypothetical protein
MIRYYLQEANGETWKAITPERAAHELQQRFDPHHYQWVVGKLHEGRVLEVKFDRKIRAIHTLS